MKWKIVFLILICLLFTGCVLGQKEEFNDYLVHHEYQTKDHCLQKTSSKEEKSVLQRFCLKECKYYAMDEELDDYFLFDMQRRKVNYVYDTITYQYDVRKKKAVCLFQGEEIDLNSSYCKNVKMMVDQHLEYFQKELDQAKVNLIFVCK